jgi:hypothetical protein
VALILVVLCGTVGVMVLEQRIRRQGRTEPLRALRETELTQANEASRQMGATLGKPQPEPVAAATEARPLASQAQIGRQAAGQAAAAPLPTGTGPVTSGKAPPQDPLARVALSFVGADPEAEAYWYAAIDDPDLPPQERQDLIEDLNEDGLTDPRHPAAEDLPLILGRLLLIEALAPYARDEVNADAFAEAHKDLVGLLNGQPPQ